MTTREIYIATSASTGKHYVGQTSQGLSRRRAQHMRCASNGKKTHLYNAIRKYGVGDFSWRVICQCADKEMADALEIFWMEHHNALEGGYNTVAGGHPSGGMLGHTHSEDTKRKMSATKLGNKHSQETKDKISAAGKGRPCSDETKLKQSIARTGKKMKPRSEEHSKQISERMKAYWAERKKNV